MDSDTASQKNYAFTQENIIFDVNNFLENRELDKLPDDGWCSALTTLYLYFGAQKLTEVLNKVLDIANSSSSSSSESEEDDVDSEEEEAVEEKQNEENYLLAFSKLIKILQQIHKIKPGIQQQEINKSFDHYLATPSPHPDFTPPTSQLFQNASLSVVLTRDELIKLLTRLKDIQGEQLLYIGSVSHAIGLRYANGQYSFYDPNEGEIGKIYANEALLADALFNTFKCRSQHLI